MKNKQLAIPLLSLFFFFLFSTTASAEGLMELKIGNDGNLTDSVQIFIMVAILSLAPSLFITLTCFTQIIIILSLTRQGLGAPTLPPNQVLTGLALFITLYIMSPVITQINEEAYTPYKEGTITAEQAFEAGQIPLKEFMYKNTETNDLKTFLKLRNESPKNLEETSLLALIPSFTLSQISEGLFKGLMIYGGFIAIDMLMGSILMFMGMFMLPPQMLSLPLKLLIFVYIGGFGKIVELMFNSIQV